MWDPARAVVDEQALHETLSLLHERTRHDFRHYKRATVLRRLERRLRVSGAPDLAAYRDYLATHPAETDALLQDMLIGVTHFFRDPQAFAALGASVIPALFEGRDATDTIRVWVAACASGEEAYTFAFLMREHAETLADAPQVKIFATDIDERAVAVGRAGVYAGDIVKHVSPNRLRRFFQREGDHYRVVASIRQSVLFAVHNALCDPPFSRLDLISCRNLLIYLDPEAQKDMLARFRFALRAGGHLFVGSSESAGPIGSGFRPVDRQHRLYAPDASARVALRPALAPSGFARAHAVAPTVGCGPDAEGHRGALEHYALPSVLIDARRQILQLSPGAAAFFTRAAGAPSHDLVANARPELRAAMETAVSRAWQSHEGGAIRATWTPAGAARQHIVIHVRPYHDADANADFALVTLQRVVPSDDCGAEVVRRLEVDVGRPGNDPHDSLEDPTTVDFESKSRARH